jgi:predicted double-glycine peptidase
VGAVNGERLESAGHFVVLHYVDNDGVIVADPALGICKLSRRDFCAAWTGNLLLIEPRGKADGTPRIRAAGVQGVKYFDRPLPRLRGLHEVGTERDKSDRCWSRSATSARLSNKQACSSGGSGNTD